MAVMNFPLSVTIVAGQALPYAGTAAGVFQLSIFATKVLIVQMALTNPILGRIAIFAQTRAACPAQDFLIFVQSCVMDKLLVQMRGMNYSPPASPTLIP